MKIIVNGYILIYRFITTTFRATTLVTIFIKNSQLFTARLVFWDILKLPPTPFRPTSPQPTLPYPTPPHPTTPHPIPPHPTLPHMFSA